MPAENNRVNVSALVLAVLTSTGLATVQYGAPPPDFQVPTSQGSRPLSQLRGKPVVINFWATWCPPCTSELPYFERLAQRYGDRIRIITVDWNEPPDVALDYLRGQGLDLSLISDRQGKIYKAYSLSEVPDTVVLDSDGKVAYVSVGGLSWNELVSAVEKVLQ